MKVALWMLLEQACNKWKEVEFLPLLMVLSQCWHKGVCGPRYVGSHDHEVWQHFNWTNKKL